MDCPTRKGRQVPQGRKRHPDERRDDSRVIALGGGIQVISRGTVLVWAVKQGLGKPHSPTIFENDLFMRTLDEVARE